MASIRELTKTRNPQNINPAKIKVHTISHTHTHTAPYRPLPFPHWHGGGWWSPGCDLWQEGTTGALKALEPKGVHKHVTALFVSCNEGVLVHVVKEELSAHQRKTDLGNIHRTHSNDSTAACTVCVCVCVSVHIPLCAKCWQYVQVQTQETPVYSRTALSRVIFTCKTFLLQPSPLPASTLFPSSFNPPYPTPASRDP